MQMLKLIIEVEDKCLKEDLHIPGDIARHHPAVTSPQYSVVTAAEKCQGTNVLYNIVAFA